MEQPNWLCRPALWVAQRETDMKPEELRGKTSDELNDLLLGSKKELFNLRFQRASGQLENTARIREVRRDIARVKTMLNVTTSQAS